MNTSRPARGVRIETFMDFAASVTPDVAPRPGRADRNHNLLILLCSCCSSRPARGVRIETIMNPLNANDIGMSRPARGVRIETYNNGHNYIGMLSRPARGVRIET